MFQDLFIGVNTDSGYNLLLIFYSTDFWQGSLDEEVRNERLKEG